MTATRATPATTTHTIGIDIGGTKIAGAVLDAAGDIVVEHRVPTPTDALEPLLDAVVALVEELARDVVTATLGVAIAGFVDASRSQIYVAPNLPLRQVPLTAELQRRTGLATVVENDANAAAWAEHRFGAGRGADQLLMVAVGTGVGGGIVSDGRLLRGAHGVAAEIGHIRAVPGGLPCGCGRHGCLEQYASGSALVREARRAVSHDRAAGQALLELTDGDLSRLTGPLVTVAAAAGDPLAVELLDDLGTALGEGIADLVAVLDPGVVVLGGGVAESGPLLLEPVRRALAANLTGAADRPLAELRLATLGNDAALIGVADLARLR